MVQIFIEFFGFCWYSLAEILFIERILKIFGIDPHGKNVKHVVLAHIFQFVLVVVIIWAGVLFYLSFIRFGLYI